MQILQADFQGSHKFSVEKIDAPSIGPDDILIKVKACYIDLQDEKRNQSLLSSSLNCCCVGRDVAGDVVQVGTNVETLKEGTAVVGVISYDFSQGGCADFCVCSQYDVVEKPDSLSYAAAAVSLGAGLPAYTALHYHGHVTAGDTVLVVDGATARGALMLQLAQAWGGKVLSTYKTEGEKQLLDNMKPPVAQMIDVTHRTNILASCVMEETGGLGVDLIVDNGVRLFTSEEDLDPMGERSQRSTPHKHDIISSLGFSGKWITSQPNLQLDPPDSQQLFLRGSSVHFLFPPAWCLMKAQHGRFMHIIRDVLNHAQNGDFKLNDIESIPLDQAPERLSVKQLDSTKFLVVVPSENR